MFCYHLYQTMTGTFSPGEGCRGALPQIYLMDQQSLLFDLNTTIRQDLSSFPFVRHYMQEQSFTSSLGEQCKVQLPFNHLINQMLSQLSILNRQIAGNSKLTTSLLQNGRDIYLKKREYLQSFLDEYPIIRDTLGCMPPHFRFVFEYSLMALSNLILKLSINMAKISIIVATRFLTPSYLNLFTCALLFEKYLELQLVRNKRFASFEEQRQFLKQFPRITVVKVGRKRNHYDSELIKRTQFAFNHNMAGNKDWKAEQGQVNNVQFLEFYETEDECVVMTVKSDHKSQYHDGFNLSEEFGLRAPFGFELYLLMSEIAVAKMLQFKPDIIIYIQDFDSDMVSIEARVRGLIINEFSEKVQHKIYVMREFGVTEQMKQEWLVENKQQGVPEFSAQFKNRVKECMDCMEPTFYTEYNSFIFACDRLQERKESIANFMRQNMQITADLFKRLQDYLKVEYRKQTVFAVKVTKEADIAFGEKLKKMHGNMLEDLTYLSLALIQKSNFDGTLNEYRNYHFPPGFLEKTVGWMGRELLIMENEKGFSEAGEHYKSKIEKLKGMKFLSVAAAQEGTTKATLFYNFLTKKTEEFKVMVGTQPRSIFIGKEDSFYVAYVDNFILLFVFSEFYSEIYRKSSSEECFEGVKRIAHTGDMAFLSKRHSTFIANSRYLYKAFGQAKNVDLNKESEIWRFSIQFPSKINGNSWQKVQSNCIHIVSTSLDKQNPKKIPKIPIQFKKFGYGFSYDTQEGEKKVNVTLFGGGFNFKMENEEKVNRFFYVIKDNGKEVYKIGKTNSALVNENENMRNKFIIYPFVFGFPIAVSQCEMIVISTNGYLENVNHFKKLFLTRVRLGPLTSPSSLTNIGIIAQNKLDYSRHSPEIAMANKNTILSYLMASYNRINRYGDRLAVYNKQQEMFMVQVLGETAMEHFDVVRVTPIDSHEMSENEDTLSVSFSAKKMVLKQ